MSLAAGVPVYPPKPVRQRQGSFFISLINKSSSLLKARGGVGEVMHTFSFSIGKGDRRRPFSIFRLLREKGGMMQVDVKTHDLVFRSHLGF
jgi:hypothetical protein